MPFKLDVKSNLRGILLFNYFVAVKVISNCLNNKKAFIQGLYLQCFSVLIDVESHQTSV